MFLRLIVIILFLCVLGGGASSALASTHAHHSGHHRAQSAVVSPFDKIQDSRPEHCVLRNHNLSGVCPQELLNPDVKGFYLASECGGTNSGTVPRNVVSSKQNIALSASEGSPAFHFVNNVMVISLSSNTRFIDPWIPPPRFI
jgi:hypothetical protein